MFGLFKGTKKKSKTEAVVESSAPDIGKMSDAKQQLFAQLQAKRQELGPEAIAKMQKAAEMQALQTKIKKGIDGDEKARERLLDEIRFQMQDK